MPAPCLTHRVPQSQSGYCRGMTVEQPVGTEGIRAGARVKRARSRRRRLIGGALALIVIVAVFVNLLPRIASYSSVLDVLGSLEPEWIAALAGIAILNTATFGPPWMAAMRGLNYQRSMVLTQTSTALASAIPGGDAVGIAVSWAMLRGWGFDQHAVAVAVLLTGVWNQVTNVLLPAAALVLLTITGETQPLLATASVLGLIVMTLVVGVLVAVLWGEQQARWVGELICRIASRALRLFGKPPLTGIGDAFVEFRKQTIHVLRKRWHVLTIATIVGHLTVFGVLLVALRACGVDSSQVNWIEALAAWGLIRLLTAVPITPGGIGIVELGLSAALVGFGGQDARVVAAVLIYRALTFLPPVVLGAILGLTWRRHRLPDPA
ncbi:MAG: putative heme transporter [Gaiellales bacterium]|nr:putative heme transporter [Gaiellales bacterium]